MGADFMERHQTLISHKIAPLFPEFVQDLQQHFIQLTTFQEEQSEKILHVLHEKDLQIKQLQSKLINEQKTSSNDHIDSGTQTLSLDQEHVKKSQVLIRKLEERLKKQNTQIDVLLDEVEFLRKSLKESTQKKQQQQNPQVNRCIQTDEIVRTLPASCPKKTLTAAVQTLEEAQFSQALHSKNTTQSFKQEQVMDQNDTTITNDLETLEREIHHLEQQNSCLDLHIMEDFSLSRPIIEKRLGLYENLLRKTILYMETCHQNCEEKNMIMFSTTTTSSSMDSSPIVKCLELEHALEKQELQIHQYQLENLKLRKQMVHTFLNTQTSINNEDQLALSLSPFPLLSPPLSQKEENIKCISMLKNLLCGFQKEIQNWKTNLSFEHFHRTKEHQWELIISTFSFLQQQQHTKTQQQEHTQTQHKQQQQEKTMETLGILIRQWAGWENSHLQEIEQLQKEFALSQQFLNQRLKQMTIKYEELYQLHLDLQTNYQVLLNNSTIMNTTSNTIATTDATTSTNAYQELLLKISTLEMELLMKKEQLEISEKTLQTLLLTSPKHKSKGEDLKQKTIVTLFQKLKRQNELEIVFLQRNTRDLFNWNQLFTIEQAKETLCRENNQLKRTIGRLENPTLIEIETKVKETQNLRHFRGFKVDGEEKNLCLAFQLKETLRYQEQLKKELFQARQMYDDLVAKYLDKKVKEDKSDSKFLLNNLIQNHKKLMEIWQQKQSHQQFEKYQKEIKNWFKQEIVQQFFPLEEKTEEKKQQKHDPDLDLWYKLCALKSSEKELLERYHLVCGQYEVLWLGFVHLQQLFQQEKQQSVQKIQVIACLNKEKDFLATKNHLLQLSNIKSEQKQNNLDLVWDTKIIPPVPPSLSSSSTRITEVINEEEVVEEEEEEEIKVPCTSARNFTHSKKPLVTLSMPLSSPSPSPPMPMPMPMPPLVKKKNKRIQTEKIPSLDDRLLLPLDTQTITNLKILQESQQQLVLSVPLPPPPPPPLVPPVEKKTTGTNTGTEIKAAVTVEVEAKAKASKEKVENYDENKKIHQEVVEDENVSFHIIKSQLIKQLEEREKENLQLKQELMLRQQAATASVKEAATCQIQKEEEEMIKPQNNTLFQEFMRHIDDKLDAIFVTCKKTPDLKCLFEDFKQALVFEFHAMYDKMIQKKTQETFTKDLLQEQQEECQIQKTMDSLAMELKEAQKRLEDIEQQQQQQQQQQQEQEEEEKEDKKDTSKQHQQELQCRRASIHTSTTSTSTTSTSSTKMMMMKKKKNQQIYFLKNKLKKIEEKFKQEKNKTKNFKIFLQHLKTNILTEKDKYVQLEKQFQQQQQQFAIQLKKARSNSQSIVLNGQMLKQKQQMTTLEMEKAMLSQQLKEQTKEKKKLQKQTENLQKKVNSLVVLHKTTTTSTSTTTTTPSSTFTTRSSDTSSGTNSNKLVSIEQAGGDVTSRKNLVMKLQSTQSQLEALEEECKRLKRCVLQKQELVTHLKSEIEKKTKELLTQNQLNHQLTTQTQEFKEKIKFHRTHLEQVKIIQQQEKNNLLDQMKEKYESRICFLEKRLDGLRASVYDAFTSFFCTLSSSNPPVLLPSPPSAPQSPSTCSSSSSDGAEMFLTFEMEEIAKSACFSSKDLAQLFHVQPTKTDSKSKSHSTTSSSTTTTSNLLLQLQKSKKEWKEKLQQLEMVLEENPDNCQDEIYQLLQFVVLTQSMVIH
jgi:hypothetical protein